VSETRYQVILADPPWSYDDKLMMSEVKRSADAHYPTMSVDDICAFDIPATTDNALLFMWVTNPFLIDGSGVKVCKTWGFTPKQLITWVKGTASGCGLRLQLGLGHYTRGATEHIILAVRGKTKQLIKNRSVPNVFVAPRTRHSAKPEESYQLIESLVDGPYVELFARSPRAGWVSFGNQLDSAPACALPLD
jgi:N6-adenosine-specific RNA methylase IME4